MRVPNWLWALIILALLCLTVGAFLGLNDLDRESRNLERLYSVKGEAEIKNLGWALGQNFIDDTSPNGLNNISALSQGTDTLFVATTDYQGEIRGFASTQKLLASTTMGAPEPLEDFLPDWLPKTKIMTLRDGRQSFVVYRPSFVNLLPTIPPGHHRRGENTTPPYPPDNLDLSDPTKAVYVWVGFSMGEFDKAKATLRTNAVIFCLLALGVIVSILLAISWLLKVIQYQAITNEIIARLPLGLILNNPSGKVVLANEAARKMTGLTQREFLGHTLGELTHDAFPEEKEIIAKEVDISFKDTPSLRLSVSCGTITAPGGGEIGRVILMADLGELNRLKDALAKQERMARLGGVASGLAHEIRNPLGAIKGLTQHLIHKTADPDEKEALTVIINCVDRMARTITEFQAYANPSINAERFELSDFLAKVHADFAMARESDGFGMELILPQGQMFVQADPAQLAVALSGLYDNAFQATAKNPGDKPGRLTVTLRMTGTNRATISFSDNGPGFGQKQLETPFVPFYSSSAKSSGLGLAKANNVIMASKGTVRLANNPGGGALVTISLPIEHGAVSGLRLASLDLGRLLKDIHAFIGYDTKYRNVSLGLEVPEGHLVMRGDKDRLTQAITNVYLNGIQATEANPPDRPRRVTVRLGRTGDDTFAIVFSDTGPGFDQTQLDNPFVPYFTTKSKGMGLGMSIIKDIIEGHGGEVKIANQPEGGGQVTLILPHGVPASPNGEPAQRPEAGRGAGNGRGADGWGGRGRGQALDQGHHRVPTRRG
jgi:two-component system sensor histidine kinase HydH